MPHVNTEISTSTESNLDVLFHNTFTALEYLEKSRVKLHNSLRAAHFSFNAAQREMERVGLLLGLPAVPVNIGAVQPRLGVIRETLPITHSNNVNDDDDNNNNNNNNNVNYEWKVVELANYGGKDPLLWFASAPSQELRNCQKQFCFVLNLCMEVVQAQEIVLAAAAAYERENNKEKEIDRVLETELVDK